ncbi:hypothetical protein EDD18DRAFT_1113155 [Armillaria luteobubalina]|uniref:Uncharacterized protein n=1 Tax=Armillaria luteobubalina TaxID=153913 RepID=A0AA39UJ66_9AGAR|nr:hypothetical protein EDD18DRAFT_1113155 [Armillaria luteobubalina]
MSESKSGDRRFKGGAAEKDDVSGDLRIGDSDEVRLKRTPLPDVDVIASPFPEPDSNHESIILSRIIKLCLHDVWSVLTEAVVKEFRDSVLSYCHYHQRFLTNPRSGDILNFLPLPTGRRGTQQVQMMRIKTRRILDCFLNTLENTSTLVFSKWFSLRRRTGREPNEDTRTHCEFDRSSNRVDNPAVWHGYHKGSYQVVVVRGEVQTGPEFLSVGIWQSGIVPICLIKEED